MPALIGPESVGHALKTALKSGSNFGAFSAREFSSSPPASGKPLAFPSVVSVLPCFVGVDRKSANRWFESNSGLCFFQQQNTDKPLVL
jgi:hypothetical protein